MAEIDFNEKLKSSKLYELAAALPEPKIALDFTVTDEASYNDALSKIKDIIKKRQQENSEEQNKKDLDALEGKDDLKEEYNKIKAEDKPRETLNVEDKDKEPEEKTPELSWMDKKRQFWTAYAAEKSLAADFNAPEGETAPVYCKLSKGDKQEGIISYSTEKDVQIAKESSLALYQGLVKDAVQNNLSVTFGKTLDDRQKLMLYAAVLLSEDTYQGTKEKVQAVNPPVLSDELMNSEVFAKLPEEAQKILKVKYHVQKLREVIKDPKAHLSPEELNKRKAKKDEIDKINAARFGITPEYKTTYSHDIKDKDGTVIHKKGDERKVEKDENLFAEDGKLKNAYSQETFNALMKRKAELEGK